MGAGHESLRYVADGDEPAPPDYLLAELCAGRLGRLTAAKRVYGGYTAGFSDLAAFFGDLAAGWHGWDGERSWESVEGDMRLEARHARGHVQLRVTVRADGPGWGNNGWTATPDLTLEPGSISRRLPPTWRAW